MVTAAAVLIAVNWGLFIYGVAIGHVVEIALGYYIGPLVNVVLGVLVLRERLRPLQWVASGIATAAVLVIAVGDHRVPWLGLGLAVTFATYGLIKKTVPLPVDGESDGRGRRAGAPRRRLLLVFAVGRRRHADRPRRGARRAAGAAGPVTAVPLLLFGAAARRIPLTTLGTLQYLTPPCSSSAASSCTARLIPAERLGRLRSSGSRWWSSPSTWCAPACGAPTTSRRGPRTALRGSRPARRRHPQINLKDSRRRTCRLNAANVATRGSPKGLRHRA